MSHELRTPLNAILGFAQLLEQDEVTDAQRDSARQLLHAGRHLLQLINERLDIARIEEGRLDLVPEPIALAEVVREAVVLVAPLAGARGIVLQADQAAWPGHVLADRQRLRQVLLNLLSNAIKYNHDGGAVEISCDPAAHDRATVRVRDSGPGIAPGMADRLVEPFDRLGAERVAIEGTGLGLAVTRKLVESMGGTITVDSTPGQGSTFQVTLVSVQPAAPR